MFKSTKIANILFGKHNELDGKLHRSCNMAFPSKDDQDKHRSIKYAGADGLILYLIKRIEKLEEKVSILKIDKNSGTKPKSK